MTTQVSTPNQLQSMVDFHEKAARAYRQYGVTDKAEAAERAAESVRAQLIAAKTAAAKTRSPWVEELDLMPGRAVTA